MALALPKRAVAVTVVTVAIVLVIFLFQDSIFGFLRHTEPPDFEISASPVSLSLLGLAGSSASATITVRSIRGFSSEVLLNATPSTGFLGVVFAFNPGRVTPPADGEVQSTFIITVYAGVPPKTHFVDVTGISNEHSIKRIVRIQVTVE